MTNCPDETLQGILALSDEPALQLIQLDKLLEDCPGDARLHFLRGSLLAALGRPGEAHAALSRGVELAPEVPLLRFQLGLLEFTSGNAAAAIATWVPLHRLRDDDALRLFVRGLESLARDAFADALALLEQGMAVNTQNPAINHDMGLLAGEIRRLLGNDQPPQPPSATEMLLSQFGRKGPRH